MTVFFRIFRSIFNISTTRYEKGIRRDKGKMNGAGPDTVLID